MEPKKPTKKILMFPWLAFGHISPFIELAKNLSKTFEIHLCSSPVNLQSIQSKLPQNPSNPIHLLHLNLPPSPELPPHLHSTNGLPLHLIPTLLNAFDKAAPDFTSILHKLNPDLLITDILQPWAVHSAAALNIPTVFFLVVGAGTFSHSVHSVLHHGVEFPFPELDLQNHWLLKRHQNDPSDSSVVAATSRFLQLLKDLEVYSDVVLVNSLVEIESKYIDYLSVLLKKTVVPVGPLVTLSYEKSDVLDWLDKKKPKSTVYVSFGSEYYLSKEDRDELAMGLEMSGANFIWVIRFGKGENIGIQEALPDGFIERVGERGLVVDGWAPQMGILKHSSTGGFVCHCGWNSVVEAAVHAVPIIALPMQLDQPCHAKVAVAAGVAIEAARGVDGAVQREGVAKAITEVLFEKIGEELSGKAKEICECLKVKDGQSIEACVVEISKILESKKI